MAGLPCAAGSLAGSSVKVHTRHEDQFLMVRLIG